MNRDRIHFLFLNIGHYLDHMFTLIFATVAALALSREWGLSYGELLKYATPGFFAFGLFSLPSGWLADKWSREGMVFLFFVGIGASSIATAFAQRHCRSGSGCSLSAYSPPSIIRSGSPLSRSGGKTLECGWP
jgi:MFS family permease